MQDLPGYNLRAMKHIQPRPKADRRKSYTTPESTRVLREGAQKYAKVLKSLASK
jgi:hypothetical protein